MSMRWEDEDYVRVYTRDTVSWKVLSWEARALWLFVLRKVNRIGMLDVGPHGSRGLAALVEMPVDVVEPALLELLESGALVETAEGYGSPNFLEAQTAVIPPHVRKKVYRQRSRLKARQAALEDQNAVGTRRVRAGYAEGTNPATNTTLRNATLHHTTVPLFTGVQSGVVATAPTPPQGSDGGGSQGGSEPTDAESASTETSKAKSERRKPEKKPRRKSKAKAKPPSGAKAFTEGFDAMFRENRGGAKPSWGAKQGKWVNDILKRSDGDPKVALERARVMFERAPKWPCETPDLATLYGHWDKFAPRVKTSKSGSAAAMPFDEYPEPGVNNDW